MTYDRAVLVEVLIYHQRASIERCACGWDRLGASHAEHVADVYEASIAGGAVSGLCSCRVELVEEEGRTTRRAVREGCPVHGERG